MCLLRSPAPILTIDSDAVVARQNEAGAPHVGLLRLFEEARGSLVCDRHCCPGLGFPFY
jgi:hypothetical protein